MSEASFPTAALKPDGREGVIYRLDAGPGLDDLMDEVRMFVESGESVTITVKDMTGVRVRENPRT